MITAQEFVALLGADFYSGVPDSQLKALSEYLLDRYGTDPTHHIIAANEGNCAALAAGYHLATGRVPVVYLQNSGEGNIINPVLSLLRIYEIPAIFIVGWRGEPGVHDEPQHRYQGEATLPLLTEIGITPFVIGPDTEAADFRNVVAGLSEKTARNESAAIVVKKGALTYDRKHDFSNGFPLTREEILTHIVKHSGDDIIVSTTGKTSRELFEIRERAGQPHGTDFLTVGSMGHCSSIALGMALQKPERRIWCLDGDGALLMHMGALAVIGAAKPRNLIHVVINNQAHESVGGMPTVMPSVDLPAVARDCGYAYTASARSAEDLERALALAVKGNQLTLLEAKSAIYSRSDLGRPTVTPLENKQRLMAHIRRAP